MMRRKFIVLLPLLFILVLSGGKMNENKPIPARRFDDVRVFDVAAGQYVSAPRIYEPEAYWARKAHAAAIQGRVSKRDRTAV